MAEESGWSIGSIRYYFPNKDELLASALWRVGERVDERIERRTAGGMTMSDLRLAATELLPLDANRREECPRHLAFLAQAAVVPALGDASEGAAQRLQEPLAAIAQAVESDELPRHLDAEHEGARAAATRRSAPRGVTTPRQTTAEWALAVLDDHLTRLPLRGLRREVAATPLPGGGDDGAPCPRGLVRPCGPYAPCGPRHFC